MSLRQGGSMGGPPQRILNVQGGSNPRQQHGTWNGQMKGVMQAASSNRESSQSDTGSTTSSNADDERGSGPEDTWSRTTTTTTTTNRTYRTDSGSQYYALWPNAWRPTDYMGRVPTVSGSPLQAYYPEAASPSVQMRGNPQLVYIPYPTVPSENVGANWSQYSEDDMYQQVGPTSMRYSAARQAPFCVPPLFAYAPCNTLFVSTPPTPPTPTPTPAPTPTPTTPAPPLHPSTLMRSTSSPTSEQSTATSELPPKPLSQPNFQTASPAQYQLSPRMLPVPRPQAMAYMPPSYLPPNVSAQQSVSQAPATSVMPPPSAGSIPVALYPIASPAALRGLQRLTVKIMRDNETVSQYSIPLQSPGMNEQVEAGLQPGGGERRDAAGLAGNGAAGDVMAEVRLDGGFHHGPTRSDMYYKEMFQQKPSVYNGPSRRHGGRRQYKTFTGRDHQGDPMFCHPLIPKMSPDGIARAFGTQTWETYYLLEESSASESKIGPTTSVPDTDQELANIDYEDTDFRGISARDSSARARASNPRASNPRASNTQGSQSRATAGGNVSQAGSIRGSHGDAAGLGGVAGMKARSVGTIGAGAGAGAIGVGGIGVGGSDVGQGPNSTLRGSFPEDLVGAAGDGSGGAEEAVDAEQLSVSDSEMYICDEEGNIIAMQNRPSQTEAYCVPYRRCGRRRRIPCHRVPRMYTRRAFRRRIICLCKRARRKKTSFRTGPCYCGARLYMSKTIARWDPRGHIVMRDDPIHVNPLTVGSCSCYCHLSHTPAGVVPCLSCNVPYYPCLSCTCGCDCCTCPSCCMWRAGRYQSSSCALRCERSCDKCKALPSCLTVTCLGKGSCYGGGRSLSLSRATCL